MSMLLVAGGLQGGDEALLELQFCLVRVGPVLLVELAGDQLHQPPLHGRGAATAYEPYQG